MEKRLKVVFDVDGVMHDIGTSACREARATEEETRRLLKQYPMREAKGVKRETIEKVTKQFHDVEFFKKSWLGNSVSEIDGMKEICEIADVYVNSISYSKEIEDFKRKQLRDNFGCIKESNITLNVVGESDRKKMELCDIIVEDCYDNIIEAKRVAEEQGKVTVGILIHREYNKMHTTLDSLSKGILIADTFDGAIQLVKKLVQMTN